MCSGVRRFYAESVYHPCGTCACSFGPGVCLDHSVNVLQILCANNASQVGVAFSFYNWLQPFLLGKGRNIGVHS